MSEYTNPRLEAIDERLALLTQVLQDQQTLTATHRLDSQERRLESNERMARVEEAIAQTLNVVQQMGERTNARLNQHDQELDDQDERTERLEQNHLEHASRMAKLEDIQADITVMLEILLRRSIPEA
jgi:hypothetical protein